MLLGTVRHEIAENIEKSFCDVWTDLGEGRDMWRAYVNAVMKFQIQLYGGIS